MAIFTPERKKKFLPLFALMCLYWLMRSLIILTGAGNFYVADEQVVGMMSHMLINGVSLGVVFDTTFNYHWGLVFLAIIGVPFMLLFGDSLVMLRYLATSYSACILAAFYLFLYRFFGRRTAILGSLFFILMPINQIKFALVLCGGYAETSLFSILAFLFFYRIFFSGEDRPRLYAFFGIVGGLGFFYDYGLLITLACCLMFWYVFDKRLLSKKMFYLCLGFFLVSFSPWFYYNATHNWNAFFVLRKEHSMLALFTENSLLVSLKQFLNFIIYDVPEYFGFKDILFVPSAVIAYVYYAVLAVSFAGVIWISRSSLAAFLSGLNPLRKSDIKPSQITPETPLIVFIFIFGFIYTFCATGQFADNDEIRFPPRLSVYMMTQLFMIAGIFLGRARRSRFGVWSSRAGAAILITIGLISNLQMVGAADFAVSSIPSGSNYFIAGRFFSMRPSQKKQAIEYAMTLEPKSRRIFFEGYKWGIPSLGQSLAFREFAQDTLGRSIDRAYWPFAYEFLGWSIGRASYERKRDDELRANTKEEFLPFFYHGLGRACAAQEFTVKKYKYLADLVGPQYLRYFNEGVGSEIDSCLIGDLRGFNRLMSEVDGQSRADIFRGLSSGREYLRIGIMQFNNEFAKVFRGERNWEAVMGRIEEKFRPYCYRRLGTELGWRMIYGLKHNLEFLSRISDQYKPEVYRGLGYGLGSRFGYADRGVAKLVAKTDPAYRSYVLEGLKTGVLQQPFSGGINE